MKLTAHWSPTCESWVCAEDNEVATLCPSWLTEHAPPDWVEELIRSNLEVAEDDVVVVSAEPWYGKVV